jgi:hypothetical protein
MDCMKARAAAGAGGRPRRYATVAEVERLKRQLAELRRNPLVRLGGVVDWAHLFRGVFSLILLGGSLAEIVRLVMGR